VIIKTPVYSTLNINEKSIFLFRFLVKQEAGVASFTYFQENIPKKPFIFMNIPYTFINTYDDLVSFYKQNADVDWLCFDTEFIGEKRFYTQLCLIQVGTEHGNFLIDPIEIDNLQPFLDLITNPKILVITHAGENDYRILYKQYDTLPNNIFDTQIAAAFAGYNYPVSFRKLVDSELNVKLRKSYTVADWGKRPLDEETIGYALHDIIYLHELWERLRTRLLSNDRLHWAQEEFAPLETAEYYYRDPDLEALKSNLMRNLNRKERVFLVRLFRWRRDIAERKNKSKEMILSSKLFGHIVRGMRSGKKALQQNRRFPSHLADRYWDEFQDMYQQSITDDDLEVLNRIPRDEKSDPRSDLLMEILYDIIKFRCLEYGVDVNMALPRGDFKQIKAEPEHAVQLFGHSWRKELFGDAFTEWLQHPEKLHIDIDSNQIALHLPVQESR
jgi:ribonuclease D